MTGLKASEEHDFMFLKYHYGICAEIRQQWHKSANNQASEKGAAVTGGNDVAQMGTVAVQMQRSVSTCHTIAFRANKNA